MTTTKSGKIQQTLKMTGVLLGILAGGLFFWGCDDSDSTIQTEQSGETLSATIRTTSYGVPHIKADNLKSLAFGQGYEFAKDYLCVLADQIVKVRSERAMYFGPGENGYNVDSDFVYKAFRVYEYAQAGYPELPQESKDIITGYVAGYNKYIEDSEKSAFPPECRNADWIKPIDEIDLLAYYMNLSIFGSGRQLVDMILAASPGDHAAKRKRDIDFPDFRNIGAGSNGWAIGRDMTETGRGAVLANPHFPYTGALRFYETHLTIPGELNVSGASLLGVPIVQIGFNDHLAWAHTVSQSMHFSVYKLRLVDGNPTSYWYDDEIREMEKSACTVRILQPDGSYTTETRTFYRSHYGLMIEHPDFMKWTDKNAFTFKDANENNPDLIQQWIAMDKARNMEEFKQAFKDYYGVPWVNTICADDQGNTFYIDATNVPHFSDDAWAYFESSAESQLFLNVGGIFLFPGDSSAYEWQGSIGPGLVPYEKAPKLERTDFVANSNNSPWLTNPKAPLENYPPIYGTTRSRQTLRARLGLKLIDEESGGDGRFSASEIQAAFLGNRSLLAELVLEDLVARCQAKGTDPVMVNPDQPGIDISEACDVLAGWDGRFNPESAGAHIFTEFSEFFDMEPPSIYEVPFDPENPVETPNTLAPFSAEGEDPVLQDLAMAVSNLEKAGVPLNAKLADVQFTKKGDEKISMPGGAQSAGCFNIMTFANSAVNRRLMNDTLLPALNIEGEIINGYTGLYSEGYLINYGASFVYVLEFTETGPQASGLVTYSSSTDPESPHFADQTRLFSRKELRPMLFTEAEITNDPNLIVETITKELK